MPVDAPEDLYGLPLDRFIPERAALVKALKADKRKDEAGEAGAMRKPSVAAWAVNQLVRTQPKLVKALFTAGDDLAAAQAGAGSGKRVGDAMREASQRQREAVGELSTAAEGLLSSDGHPLSAATLERVGDTLRAAALNPEARRQVETGCLTQELQFAGLGLGGLAPASDPVTAPDPAPAPAPAKTKVKTKTKTKTKTKGARSPKAEQAEDKAAARARAKAEAEENERVEQERRHTAALKAARQAATEARRTADQAEKDLAAAQARHDAATAALAEAERAVEKLTQAYKLTQA